ncbi:MAG: glutamine--tRNA ligase/YqeY domain fusion protein [Lautropia sp.]|nr:glutamine--tRNA ligase/YqeY domain fusion protein [Lautropia sp.]
MKTPDTFSGAGSPAPSNFIRQAIESDLASGRLDGRTWSGHPGPAAIQRTGPTDPARIRTRFPPEPNGFLHIGHAKSICLNFDLAASYDGRCHLRFDDTNPEKENQEYVDAIMDSVRWLGFDWCFADGEQDLYFASDYFEIFYQIACRLIEAGHAYVDSQTGEQIRENRGTLTEPGRPSPYRERPAQESLRLFQEMRAGQHPEGAMVLRARIDMASPNLNLRDPILYRIRFAHHHRTGNDWPIYPMYDYAHPLEDALEGITHSLCTLEFEDHRPLYDWLLARVAETGMLDAPLPRQIEFARLNLTYTITSKRKLKALVDQGIVTGWDDPRMTTLAGLRRRGYPPAAIRLFCERAGVSKANQLIEMSVLEQTVREVLDPEVDRLHVVTDPIRLVIENLPPGQRIPCEAPRHPHHPERGVRQFELSHELWIEREDFAEHPPKGFFRMTPGQMVRLRHGFVVQCTGVDRDAQGNITQVRCTYLPDTRSGTPGADSVKVKGNIHWVSASDAVPVELRIFAPLFLDAQPDAGGQDPLQNVNPASRTVRTGYAEPLIRQAQPEQPFQFERQGYFVADRLDHTAEKPVFNRITTLKDSFGRKKG